mmetsp:Transcript_17750/g.42189  ORF Transcript_17750/g.42189 Transcript_17750/m.42189 type:complete len:86 (-) Transcript_17750:163-420(-)
MRKDSPMGTAFLRKNRRNFSVSRVIASDIIRSCVSDPVMLPTMYENAIKAKSTVNVANPRSIGFDGWTSMDAGVNWHSDQCKLVR